MGARGVGALVAVWAVVAACGGSGDGSMIFGERSGPCAPTVLANEDDDAEKVEEGADCFLAELDAGRPVVWDVLLVTVEGDPIPTRYEFDGDTVTITADNSRDAFGSDGVERQRCDSVRRTNWLPEGVDCATTGGDGFDSQSLPGSG